MFVPDAVMIGPVTIHVYGLLIGVAIVMGGSTANFFARRWKRQNALWPIRPGEVWDALLWAAVPGVVMARLYHVADYWWYYGGHLAEVVAVWNGGLGIWGGIVGGVVGVWGYCLRECSQALKSGNRNFLGRRRWRLIEVIKWFRCTRHRLLSLLDTAGMGLPVGQAIGRLGNWVNQELYGKPTDVPWGIYIDPTHRLPGVEEQSRFHPLFAYEAWLNLGLLLLLTQVDKRRGLTPGEGQYFAVYLFGYSMIRFWLEPLRIVSWRVGDIWVAQVVAVLFMLLSLLWLMVRPKKVL